MPWHGRRRVLRAATVSGQYNHVVPNLDYVNAVLKEFPEAAVASPDEARALYSHGGYTILDVRNDLEVDKYGKIVKDVAATRRGPGGVSVGVPFEIAHRRFVDGEQVVEKERNPYFVEDVLLLFPNREAKLLVMDFDGHSCAVDALDTLFDEGYENIVGLQGGYRAWFMTWDNKLKRRNLGEYQEHSWGEGETSCGIHASGAGFENQDAQSADFWKSF